MNRLITTFLIVALATPAFGGEYKFAPGTKVTATVQLQADATGELSIVVPGQVITIGSITPSTDKPTDPNPTDLQSFAAAAVKSEVTNYDNRSRDALRLSYAYSTVVGLIDDGKITTSAKADEILKTSVDATLSYSLAGNKWNDWRRAISAKLNSMGIQNLAGVRKAYSEIQTGLSAEQMAAYVATEEGAAHDGPVTPEDVLSSEAWGDGMFLKFFMEVILPILLKLLLSGI